MFDITQMLAPLVVNKSFVFSQIFLIETILAPWRRDPLLYSTVGDRQGQVTYEVIPGINKTGGQYKKWKVKHSVLYRKK